MAAGPAPLHRQPGSQILLWPANAPPGPPGTGAGIPPYQPPGLSPEYRGADCTFWALYNGEPEKVGCTLHWIDTGIDTGGLIAHISPKIEPDDDELRLFWRSVQTSAGVYAEFLARTAAGEHFGQTQPHKGRLYQVKQRGLRHERLVDQRLKDGLLRNLHLDTRVTWFPAAAAANRREG